MIVNEITEQYAEYREFTEAIDECKTSELQMKYSFISDSIFGITTYDFDMDCMFGEIIHETMKAIYEKKTEELIIDLNKYDSLIIVCNLLDKCGLINWGTSIRYPWFEFGDDNHTCLTEQNIEYFINDFLNDDI